MDPFASEGEDDRGLLRLEVREHAFYIHIYIYIYTCVLCLCFFFLSACVVCFIAVSSSGESMSIMFHGVESVLLHSRAPPGSKRNDGVQAKRPHGVPL